MRHQRRRLLSIPNHDRALVIARTRQAAINQTIPPLLMPETADLQAGRRCSFDAVLLTGAPVVAKIAFRPTEKRILYPAAQAVCGNAQPLVQGRIGVAQVVGARKPSRQNIRVPPAGVKIGWHRDDFEARFAEGSRRPGHVHRRGHQKDSMDALRGEYFVAADGVFVCVDGAAFYLDCCRWDVPFFKQSGHPGGLGSLAGLAG